VAERNFSAITEESWCLKGLISRRGEDLIETPALNGLEKVFAWRSQTKTFYIEGKEVFFIGLYKERKGCDDHPI
jgi:hypothetical protein